MATVMELFNVLISVKGAKYVFGEEVDSSEEHPSAFDCAELVEWACARIKVKPKMVDGSWRQYLHCKKQNTTISVEEALKTKGALLFIFSSEPDENSDRPNRAHVAVSMGNGFTFEARSAKMGVGIFEAGNRSWTHGAKIPGISY